MLLVGRLATPGNTQRRKLMFEIACETGAVQTPVAHDCGWCGRGCDRSIVDRNNDPICIRCAILPGPGDPQKQSIQARLTRVGKAAIVATCVRNEWSLANAALEMGITHKSLYGWMKKNASDEMERARASGVYRSVRSTKVTRSKERLLQAVNDAKGDLEEAARQNGISSGRTILRAFKRLAPKEHEQWAAWRVR